MRWGPLAIGVVAFLGAGGCGSDDEPPPTDEPAGVLTAEERDAENYRIGYTVCSTFSPEKLASDLGISSTDPVSIATAHSEQYRLAFRQAPFEGCLDALLGKAQSWDG